MATGQSTIDFLCDQLRALHGVRVRKMFGEYALYFEEKVVALVCDDQLFVKITPAGKALVGERYEEGEAYPGAKPSILIGAEELDDHERLCELIRVTAAGLPPPQAKKAGRSRKQRDGLKADPTQETTTDKLVAELLVELRSLGSDEDRAGKARYGINVEQSFGVSTDQLRMMARRLGTNHELALALWETGNHDARLLACFVDDPTKVTDSQVEAWARDFDSWDICDQATTSLFDQTRHAWSKAVEWSAREEEWVKRAGFSLMAGLAVHDKLATNRAFLALLPVIKREAVDERNFVKKAVNWALRNIGKRNRALNVAAIACAERIRADANKRAGGPRGGDVGARTARWVAADALRELASEKIQARLKG